MSAPTQAEAVRYIIVRDGTVPIVLARVLHSDPPAPLDDAYLAFEHLGGEVDSYEFGADCTHIGWWWADSDSDATGFTDFAAGLAWLMEPPMSDVDGKPHISEVGPGHIVACYAEGQDHESYAHLWDVRGGRGQA